jgi:endonuclease I
MILTVLILGSWPVQADPPPGYYDSVDPSSPETMRATLHAVIDDHTKIPYTSSSTDTWDVLEQADEDPLDSNSILDVYRNRDFTKRGGGNDYYNREHTWPNSYGFPDDGSTNKPYSDCHHLFLCDISYNGYRGSRVFDDCPSGCTARSTDEHDGISGVNYTRDDSPVGVWETWQGRRGDVARAILYMDVRYEGTAGEPDLIATDDVDLIVSCQTGDNEPVGYMGLLTVLLEWHEQDPVDDKERSRNDVVYQYQHNRNPFIDHPEWVDILWGDPVSATPDGVTVPAAAFIAGVHPNPFNPVTNVVFTLAEPGEVRLEIFALDGRRVRTLVAEHRAAGEHRVLWNGRNDLGTEVASGAYLVRLQGGGVEDGRKVLLLK